MNSQALADLYKFRYVIYSFIGSTLRIRYRRSFLGYLWTVIAPLSQYVLIGVVFKYASKIDTPDYYAYFFSGAIAFNLFSTTVNRSATIMLNNEAYIKKVYLPKFIYVINAVGYEVANFLITFASLFIVGILLGYVQISYALFLLPISILLASLFLFGVSCIVSVVGVYFRDLNYIVPPILQALFFGSPIAYKLEVLPGKLQSLILLNPFYSFIECFRVPLVYGTLPSTQLLVLACTLSISMFVIGIWVIRVFDNKIVFKL